MKEGNEVQKYKDKLVRKFTQTKKCGCLFKLKEKFVRTIGWKITLECGFHNHKVMTPLFGHSYVGCLSSEEKLWLTN